MPPLLVNHERGRRARRSASPGDGADAERDLRWYFDQGVVPDRTFPLPERTSNLAVASSEKEREWQERRDLDLKKWKEQDERERNEREAGKEIRTMPHMSLEPLTQYCDLTPAQRQQIEVLNKRVRHIGRKMDAELKNAQAVSKEDAELKRLEAEMGM